MNSDIENLKERACQFIDTHAQTLIDVSHQIHANPEENYEEHFAADLLCRTSTDLGLSADKGAYGAPTGFVADMGVGNTVCIMSEYDALPDIGHGCGHNVIAAAGLGAAVALGSIAANAGGRVR